MKARDIWYRIFAIKAITSIEIRIEQDGSWIVSKLDLKSSRDNPVISNYQTFNNEKELFESQAAKAPVCLIITGKGVLKKRISLQKECTTDELLMHVLPNAQITNFYVHAAHIGGSDYDITIIRKSLVEEVLNKLSSHNIQVIEMFFGNHFISSCGFFKDNILDEDQKTTIAGAYQFLVNQKGKSHSESTEVKKQWLDNYHGRLFKQLGMGFLILCLGMLLVNFLAFDHFNKRLAELSGKGDQINNQLQHYEELKRELTQKKQLLNESGFDGISRNSFYLDRIASSRSEGITLTEIDVNPKQDGLRSDDITFKNKTILIKGKANNSLELNEWVNKLKEYDWAKQVKIEGYNHSPKENSAGFQLSITIKS